MAAALDRVDGHGHAGVGDMVDLARYPIDRPGSEGYRAAVARARAGLAADGCARLAGFIRPDRHADLEAETTRLAPAGEGVPMAFSPYVGGVDERFPEDHPRRRLQHATNRFVAQDRIPRDTLIQALYTAPCFQRFLADCFQKPRIHVFADPIRGLVLNIMADGTELPWHFDANEFIVSLMTRPAQAGGVFEYCPGIRAPGDEGYDRVQAVLDGDRARIRPLDLEVGDVQLFRGRYALHRVTRVTGERHSVLFGYAEDPGFIGSVDATRRAFGRVTQAHLDAEAHRHADGLAD